MIDLLKEEVAPLGEATRKWVPHKHKPPHPSTLWRWHRHGLRGAKLEVVKIGGVAFTSREALIRFFERCTSGDPSPTFRTTAERRNAIRQAEAVLNAARI
jgi:hypothetical protein